MDEPRSTADLELERAILDIEGALQEAAELGGGTRQARLGLSLIESHIRAAARPADEQAKLGICPVCENLFREVGHSFGEEGLDVERLAEAMHVWTNHEPDGSQALHLTDHHREGPERSHRH